MNHRSLSRSSQFAFCLVGLIATTVGSIAIGADDASSPITPSGRITSETDGWSYYAMKPTRLIETHRTIHPAGWTASDATRNFLAPDQSMVDDNAAVWYLQASGFLEQQAAQEAYTRFNVEEGKRMVKDPEYHPAPYRWWSIPPDELPVKEVRDYLSILSFQTRFLERAFHCRNFDLQRNARGTKDPINYLLPEIQEFRRTIARTQQLRSRLALAERRIDDAIKRIGQNLQFAHHLSHDPFTVVTTIAENITENTAHDLFHLVTHPSCPNLYDAFNRLPDPLIGKSDAIEFENGLLFYQVPALRDVEADASSIDWPRFIEESLPKFGDCKLTDAHGSAGRLSVGLFIAATDAESASYLQQQKQTSEAEVAAMRPTERFFLAVIGFQQQLQMQMNRARQLTPEIARKQVAANLELVNQYPTLFDTIKWALPNNGNQITRPQHRPEQILAMLQTIEALRDHLASFGEFPQALSEMRLPPPADPLTGLPISYALRGQNAILTTADNGFERRQIVLTAAEGTDAPGETVPSKDDVVEPKPTRIVTRCRVPSGGISSETLQQPWWSDLTESDRSRVQVALGQLLRAPTDSTDALVTKTFAMNVYGQTEPAGQLSKEATLSLAEAEESNDPGTKFQILIAIPDLVRQAINAAVGDRQLSDSSQAMGRVIGATRWIAVQADLDSPSIEIIMQCNTTESANGLVQHLVPAIGETYQLLTGMPESDALVQSLQRFSTRVDDNQIRFDLEMGDQAGASATAGLAIVAGLLRNLDDATVKSRMRQLMLAVHNYHSAYRSVPPNRLSNVPTINKGLSWRVAILPFIEKGKYQDLYRKFDLSQPWDSPVNKPLLSEIPEIFRPIERDETSAGMESGMTTFQSTSGEDAAMGNGGAESFRQVVDGLSNTVFIVETASDAAVPWTAPQDHDFRSGGSAVDGLSVVNGQTNVAFGDGWAGNIRVEQPPGTWKGMFTRSGEEPIGFHVEKLRD